MGDLFDPVANGRAAGKNGQELCLENELTLLKCIKTEGLVREYEASLITGMSPYMIGMVSRRLAKAKAKAKAKSRRLVKTKNSQIHRKRFYGNAGYFLRLLAPGAERVDGKSGKDIAIPSSWRHHAMAIQTLHYLATKLHCSFETEASMRRRLRTGKFPDGRLVSDSAMYYFEQERTKKSGKYLGKQTEIITQLAASGTNCYIGYPYPASICGGVDHETRQANSIRHKWGSSAAPNIKLVRCHFDSLIEYQNVHVSRFEIIELPAMVSTSASKKDQPGVTDQIMGFKWLMKEHCRHGEILSIGAALKHCDEICFEGVFTRAASGGDYHSLESGGLTYGRGYADLETFDDFVRGQQKGIERSIQGDIDMCAMQARAEAEEKIDWSKFDLP